MTSPPPGGPGHILVLGECLADVAPATVPSAPGPAPAHPGRQTVQHLVAMPGGSPANVAVGLARLGRPALFAGRFSTAGLGPWLKEHMQVNGVDLTFSVDVPEAATIALVTLDEQGRATYAFYGPETADWHWRPGQLPSPEALSHRGQALVAVHTGSLVAAFPPGATVVKEWLAELRRSSDVLISFDPNVRPGLSGDFGLQRRLLGSMMSSAHLVKASHEDVEAIYPGSSVDSTAQRWLTAGAVLVVITEGANGARLIHRDGAQVQGRPPAIQVVDTIGAGDSFTAGLLAHLGDQGLLHPRALAGATREQLEQALSYALRVSAITCTRAGADPPDGAEVDHFSFSA